MPNGVTRRAVLGAAIAAGAAGRAQAAETLNYYIHQSAPQFTTSIGAQRLVQAVDKASGGDVKVRRHLAGTLQIDASNITQAVADDVVDMGDDLFFSGNIPVGAVLRLPFLVQSYDDYNKATAVLLPYVTAAYAEKGITLLAPYTYPNQYIWGRRKIATLSDIKNQKLRTVSPEQGEFIRRFGGSSVSLGAAEVPSALDRGVVDGLITGTVGAELWKDLLKFGFLLGLNFNNSYIIVNTQRFKSLSQTGQAALQGAAVESANWNTETMKQDDVQILAKFDPAKMAVITPSAEEIALATKTMEPYWADWAKERGPTATEALTKIRAALGR